MINYEQNFINITVITTIYMFSLALPKVSRKRQFIIPSKYIAIFPPSCFLYIINELINLLVDKFQTECVGNTVVAISDISRKSFIYLVIECELMGLTG